MKIKSGLSQTQTPEGKKKNNEVIEGNIHPEACIQTNKQKRNVVILALLIDNRKWMDNCIVASG